MVVVVPAKMTTGTAAPKRAACRLPMSPPEKLDLSISISSIRDTIVVDSDSVCSMAA